MAHERVKKSGATVFIHLTSIKSIVKFNIPIKSSVILSI